MEALRLYTLGSAWFSGEEDKKGSIEVGKFADLVVLSDDYFSVSDEEKIRNIQSVLTIVGGKIVYAMNDFKHLAPQPLPIKPSWSPVATFGGYYYTHNNAIFSSSDNYSGTSNKNTDDEKTRAKEELISSNTQTESIAYLDYQIDENNGNSNLSYYYTKADKNTNNNKSVMQRGLCSCCDDFFSF